MNLTIPEKPVCNVVNVYRERGNYLQRLEQFEKAIIAYTEALRWNAHDVPSLLGRSQARSKATHYTDALADVDKAAALDPENIRVKEIRAQTEYEKCAFERALVLAHCGVREREMPPHFAECRRHAEKTVQESTGKSAQKVLNEVAIFDRLVELKGEYKDPYAPEPVFRKSRLNLQQTHSDDASEMSRSKKHRYKRIFRLMASKYLERMAYDKYFLMSLNKDDRLKSANKAGSHELKDLAKRALKDLENRQAVLRERRPLYAALAEEERARARLLQSRKKQVLRTQKQNITDAKRLVNAAQILLEKRDTCKCLEHAEFAIEQIIRKPQRLLPGKEKFLTELRDIIAEAFLDQKRAKKIMSESDREKRAFVLLGIPLSREPSNDSILRVRPPMPPRDAKKRLRYFERALRQSTRASELCYVYHELARLHIETKQVNVALHHATRCQTEARKAGEKIWLLNAMFLLARCHTALNNRSEARANLCEAVLMAKTFDLHDVASFLETCVEISMEGEVPTAEAVEMREKAMVKMMQDDDLKSAAEHLFRKMSVMPTERRFSVMPGSKMDETGVKNPGRRQSIMPKSQQPATLKQKKKMPLGFQNFDI